MKEEIYTIPVIEAFQEDTPCPLCSLYKKLDNESVMYTLGPSYMEDDIRTMTNEKGFCRRHYERLYSEGNRLGLSMICHTHLHKVQNDLRKFAAIRDVPGAVKYIGKLMGSCFICEKIERTFDRYVDTLFYMWKKRREIIKLVSECKGFCINHFTVLAEEGKKKLNSKEYAEFMDILEPMELNYLQKLHDDLDWFIMKYDYRNRDEPWLDAKDAPVRALTALASIL